MRESLFQFARRYLITEWRNLLRFYSVQMQIIGIALVAAWLPFYGTLPGLPMLLTLLTIQVLSILARAVAQPALHND